MISKNTREDTDFTLMFYAEWERVRRILLESKVDLSAINISAEPKKTPN